MNITLNETARNFAHTFLDLTLKNGDSINEEVIKLVIDRVRAIDVIPGESFDEVWLLETLISDYSIASGSISVIEDNSDPWLNDARSNINFELWNRYKLHLSKNDPNFPIGDLDRFTDTILDKCGNPEQQGTWDRRGMVVGHVQSGKTANYIGLINKATDAGYKVIIVLAGSSSTLRRQTQERIDESFVGRDSSAYLRNQRETRIKGVGQTPVNTDIYPLTSAYYKNGDEGDFNTKVFHSSNIPIGNNPVVFVIKKNKTILENLIDWFSYNENIKLIDGHRKLQSIPVLVIDDESDYASVNTGRDIDDVRTINRLIRVLLNLFEQNTFIGYTATPFANLFISKDHNQELLTRVKDREYYVGPDLFPKDFIINIKPGSNYIGAAQIFGLDTNGNENIEALDIVREIKPEEYEPPFIQRINKHNRHELPEVIPDSLKNAVRSFVLTSAVRRLRGQANKHNSMLIHVALYITWIDRIALLTDEYLTELKQAIEAKDPSTLVTIEKLYKKDYIPTTQNVLENLAYKDNAITKHTWEEVLTELYNSVAKIQVRAVHGRTSISQLEYHNIKNIDYVEYEKTGLSVIAVGGGKLSRGITLDGLSISYYLRTTRMYDSLMQMGRWFGYRPGYVDLCRLYTNRTIFDWFNHITMATEEMRNDFDELTARNLKPIDYRLRVRDHPGMLAITSVAKLHFAETINVSFSGSNLQTYMLSKSAETIKENYRSYCLLCQHLGDPLEKNITTNQGRTKYILFRDSDIQSICLFLDSFKTNTPRVKNANLSEYIKNQTEIKEWNICFVGNTDEQVFIDINGNANKSERKPKHKVKNNKLKFRTRSISLGSSVRNHLKSTDSLWEHRIRKSQIDDNNDRQVDLSIENVKKAKDIKDQRAKEGKGLLLIYTIDPRGIPNIEDDIPLIGYSIYFPVIEHETKTAYVATVMNDFDDEPMTDYDDDDMID